MNPYARVGIAILIFLVAFVTIVAIGMHVQQQSKIVTNTTIPANVSTTPGLLSSDNNGNGSAATTIITPTLKTSC